MRANERKNNKTNELIAKVSLPVRKSMQVEGSCEKRRCHNDNNCIINNDNNNIERVLEAASIVLAHRIGSEGLVYCLDAHEHTHTNVSLETYCIWGRGKIRSPSDILTCTCVTLCDSPLWQTCRKIAVRSLALRLKSSSCETDWRS